MRTYNASSSIPLRIVLDITTVNSISAGKMNKRGVAYAENENRLMRQFQVDQWNRQNEYNDPKNIMARVKAAGIKIGRASCRERV